MTRLQQKLERCRGYCASTTCARARQPALPSTTFVGVEKVFGKETDVHLAHLQLAVIHICSIIEKLPAGPASPPAGDLGALGGATAALHALDRVVKPGAAEASAGWT